MKLVEYFCDRLNNFLIFAKMLKNFQSKVFLNHSIFHIRKVFKKPIIVLFHSFNEFFAICLFCYRLSRKF